jgi:hypothetical protein
MTTIRISRGKFGTCVRLTAGKGESLNELVAALAGEPRAAEKWISHAQWPLDVYHGERGDGISSDTHLSEAEALAVCRGLERYGFGGQARSFPIKTWVTRGDA